jgi:hypothetical protein
MGAVHEYESCLRVQEVLDQSTVVLVEGFDLTWRPHS